MEFHPVQTRRVKMMGQNISSAGSSRSNRSNADGKRRRNKVGKYGQSCCLNIHLTDAGTMCCLVQNITEYMHNRYNDSVSIA